MLITFVRLSDNLPRARSNWRGMAAKAARALQRWCGAVARPAKATVYGPRNSDDLPSDLIFMQANPFAPWRLRVRPSESATGVRHARQASYSSGQSAKAPREKMKARNDSRPRLCSACVPPDRFSGPQARYDQTATAPLIVQAATTGCNWHRSS